MHCYDIVGYADDCEVFCLNCGDDHMHPIFADSEWDYYPTCDNCLEVIEDVCLISYGQDQEDRRRFFQLLHEARKAKKV